MVRKRKILNRTCEVVSGQLVTLWQFPRPKNKHLSIEQFQGKKMICTVVAVKKNKQQSQAENFRFRGIILQINSEKGSFIILTLGQP